MARLIKCPRCQSQLDVTNVAGGTTMRCSDCGAMLRVPTGTTGQYQKVPSSTQPAVKQASSGSHAKVGGRSTSLFKKMSGVKAPGATGKPPRGGGEERRGGYAPRKSGNGAMIGIGAGIAGVVAVLVIVLMATNSSKEQARLEKEAYRKKVEQQNKDEKERQRKEDEEYDKALAAQKEAEKAGKKKDVSLTKKAGGAYEAPATFEPGASKQKTKAADLQVDDALVKEYEGLASAGKIKEILDNDNKWTPYIINGLISDNEAVAKTSFQALADFCVKHKISTSEEGFKNPVKMELVNSAYYRGGEYTFWTEWWSKDRNKNEVAARGGKGGDRESARVVGEDPARAKWDELMQYLRAGGGYDDPKRPEGMAFAKVKNMGDGAYPYLVKYIDNEDIMLARAAVKVLNELLGKDVPLPNEGNKAQIKTQMENLIKK